MKQTLLNNWNFMRFTRLALGIFIIAQAVMVKDITMGLMGIFFTALPLLNIGCCGGNGCHAPVKRNSKATNEVSYEEVVK